MSTEDPRGMEFEERVRQALRESAERVPGRVRSRLTQARQAALTEAEKPRRAFKAPGLWPALGALTAVLLVALVIGHQEPMDHPDPSGQQTSRAPVLQAATERPTVEDLDLLADSDGLDLVQGDDGAFYEWAMQQAEGGETPPGSGNGV